MRVLDIDGTYQSATFTDDGWCDLPFPYMETFDVAFDALLAPRNLLMLGGGGFAYPKHIVAHHPNARIDVVEIDPTIVELAHRYFYLEELMDRYQTSVSKRLAIVVEDALSYLRQCVSRERRYDAIFNDCFAGMKEDQSLATPNALRQIHECLIPQGMYVVNLLTALSGEDSAPLKELVMALSQVFDYVLAVPCRKSHPEEYDNVVIVATDSNPYLEEAITLYESYNT